MSLEDWAIPGLTVEESDAFWAALSDRFGAEVEARVDAMLADCPECSGE